MKTYEKIKQLRENREITQKEISNKLNINVSVYNKIELGIRPLREEELTAIADFFNVSIDYLTGRTENPTTPSNNQKEAGQNIISHFRLNTSDMDIEDIEELEEELIDFQDFLIKKAKEKKARNKKD
ncbi:helix-turn-helix transcriptional regulator [Enterococcus faecalis]|uniref:helix-turn-helix domain-containing protein n=2 Tax=Enterococcus faecalis TaxID=1351 RepID=UPI000FFF0EDD|nr:helix-turn-helix transcriptional regulator [Enterococcus faecalis]EGO2732893.1 helix-turn-helix transcriptional regulator [Enterococcus faecalis]EHU5028926.1 helix-turn-helix transcriptional regulator [Enterococcus faecalis]EKJ5043955.1 helix-turn-helix transcriptional regulator [Enterococcus faecalis]MCU2287134.1 helix-turn-helix domain-containing protein [Enterococcus faecalis]MDT2101271.1 helix-turn-helix transcriptional regulator [Enterococcus faecalis]